MKMRFNRLSKELPFSMKHRIYSIIAACMATFLSLPLGAQIEAPPLPRLELAATTIGLNYVPELYWRDIIPGPTGQFTYEYKRLNIGSGNRGARISIPFQGPVQLFRKTVSQQEGASNSVESMVPVISLQQPRNRAVMLLVLHRDRNGAPTYLLRRFNKFTPSADCAFR